MDNLTTELNNAAQEQPAQETAPQTETVYTGDAEPSNAPPPNSELLGRRELGIFVHT